MKLYGGVVILIGVKKNVRSILLQPKQTRNAIVLKIKHGVFRMLIS